MQASMYGLARSKFTPARATPDHRGWLSLFDKEGNELSVHLHDQDHEQLLQLLAVVFGAVAHVTTAREQVTAADLAAVDAILKEGGA